jgi:pyridoxal phosphate enzyme (YggS family)
MSSLIKSNLAKITSQIPNNVRLIAVTKKVSVESMREAYAVGIRDFAENRLQEAIAKQAQLTDLKDICWHFIGHLQTNKAKKAVENFTWIHSVDSIKIAERLNHLAEEAIQQNIITFSPKICLQVKILPDPNKYGLEKEELLKKLAIINELKYLKISGLMAILPLGLSEEEILIAFTKVKDLATQINQENLANLQIQELSMGMSGDYLLALKAGATMIRLGTIIFGNRNY